MAELAYLSATELAPLIESKQLSPVELTKHVLNRIATVDPTIHSYITALPELALKQAREAENNIMNGRYKGPLHGIPIGIKDNYYTKGIRTTAASKLFADFIPEKNATAVEKLLGAGGIMLGKLNMHELALGSTGTNQFYNTTRNPWNIHYMPGGSSGGSSAALAAGLATLATGSDTFGSIRLPAAMCGIYGLKPTYGLVSTYGIFPSAWSLDTAGPMARTVSDLALMLNNMAGFDTNDPASLRASIPDYTEDLYKEIRGIKIGIPTYFLEELDTDVERLFKNAIATLKSLGVEIREIEIPELTMSTFSGYSIVTGESSAFHYEWLQTQPEDYGMDNRPFLLSGTLTNTPQYVKAQQSRRKLVEAFHKAFKSVDIMLGPTIPITTPAFAQNWVEQNLEVIRRCLPFTVPVNLSGTPSLSVPMGLCSNGLPVGMQFIGNHLSEEQLLQVGYAWESINPFQFQIMN
ncbi:amidase [Tenuibacillus multivorans]|uniref:Aspartyl-tRNA(Asn)/glutamyl-tRNA(Gln) amidotransferase subunit A n=1 Tax=Tenuibacillus multivorans TaxID=237069 RepID=A0A1H0FQI9_9BACI|nr:amidase [Tenuibacillus multivorans]GEL77926.1 amidase [Tenuibacillus multivorans]SDN96897.1 aspartyl-tRNA(Asn)/glutamyl-tRNA(Gln) amidotransferase subunit A [Tenuibacillus multivorans]